jgi:hypothetical protein
MDLAVFAGLVLGGLSAAAGGIHGAAMPEHARDHWLFGVFFAASAAFQIAWAIGAMRSITRRFLIVGAVANAGFVLLWFVTRTTGVPIGPEPWMAEPVGFVDGVTVAFEISIVALAVRLAGSGAFQGLSGRRTPTTFVAASLAAAAIGLWGLAAARAPHMEAAASPAHTRQLWVGAAVVALVVAWNLLRRASLVRPPD